MVISEETKKQLHQAIDLAQGYGACKYVHEDKPMCVVAQFAHLSGTSVAEMKDWGMRIFTGVAMEKPVSAYLKDNLSILTSLQFCWDGGFPSPESAREEMHRIVDAA
jgi:hypothetical protein